MSDRLTRAVKSGLIKFAKLAGAADSSTVGLTCTAGDGTAIAIGDKIIACLNLTVISNAIVDVTASTAIIAGGKITVPESNTDTIAVWWMACNAERQIDSCFIQGGIVAGGNAAAALTLTGIDVGDVIISSIEVVTDSGAWTDRTAHTTIYAADTIKCSDATNSAVMYVLWMANSCGRAVSSFLPYFGLGTLSATHSAEPSPSPQTSPVTDVVEYDTVAITGIEVGDVIYHVLCVDETDYDAIADLTSSAICDVNGYVRIVEPSPSVVASAKILVFFQKGTDVA